MFWRSPRHFSEVCPRRVISSRPETDWLSTFALPSATTIVRLILLACRHLLLLGLLVIPVMPCTPKALQSDCPAKPQLPTSTGRFQVFHLPCWHSSSNGWYLAFFLSCGSSILSSNGTVNSISTTLFVALDSSSTSGCNVVVATSGRNFSCPLRSTRSSQSLAAASSPVSVDLLFVRALPPSRMILMKVGFVCPVGFFFRATSRLAAISLRILSCRHRYLPSEIAVLQEDWICSKSRWPAAQLTGRIFKEFPGLKFDWRWQYLVNRE